MRFSEYLRAVLLGLAIALPVAIFFNWALRDYQPGYPDRTNQPNCEATKVAILSSDEAKRLVFLNVCDDEFSTKRLHNSVEQSPANNETNGHDTEVVNQAISAADLIEQRSMASSTYVIMWATALGLFVAAGGLVLISRTLSATRETLSVTQASLTYSETTARQAMKATEAAVRAADAAENAERAQILVGLKCVFCGQASSGSENLAHHSHKRQFKIEPRVKNYGKTPALNVQVRVGNDKGMKLDDRMNRWAKYGVLASGASRDIKSLPMYGAESLHTVKQFDEVKSGLIAEWSFDDVFGNTRYGRIDFKFGYHMPYDPADSGNHLTVLIQGLIHENDPNRAGELSAAQEDLAVYITDITVDSEIKSLNRISRKDLSGKLDAKN